MELFDALRVRTIDMVNDIRANLGATGTNATGRTSQSLRFEITQNGGKMNMRLYGRPFFMTVQTGRRPTPEKKPSREMIDNLRVWMEARGMDASKVWGLATKINQRGTRLWLEGGREDIVDPVVDEFINGISMDALAAEQENFILNVRKWSQ
jgi:hypothetical protein